MVLTGTLPWALRMKPRLEKACASIGRNQVLVMRSAFPKAVVLSEGVSVAIPSPPSRGHLAMSGGISGSCNLEFTTGI